MGHAGAIISAYGETAEEKVEMLSSVGNCRSKSCSNWKDNRLDIKLKSPSYQFRIIRIVQ